MSGRLRQVTADEAARVARMLGFVLARQKGSHASYKRAADQRLVVIPMHRGNLKPGTLHRILKDLNLSPDEFAELL
ncbi:MAG TPA: type II toxin-antitoxin system HicA family toxin [Planctomycetota bacterium]|jgi:predicted RNA binding protein YcfA (HicA-like mRNA interferase family)